MTAHERTAEIVGRLVQTLEARVPWGLRRAVDKDRKADEATRPILARPDRETFRFFELEEDRPMTLDELIPGNEVQTPYGPAWISERALSSFWSPLPSLPEPDPSVLWFDIETQGGKGNPGFLFGAVFHNGEDWILWQALARTEEEESALLHLCAQIIVERPNLVSYSGSKNDWPFLHGRWIKMGIPVPKYASHLDLFDAAQPLYRGVLPSCRLVTLERHLCGRWREADLPSGYIPAAYQDWLRQGDARLLAQVMLHNALDVVCLLELQPLLAATFSPLPPRQIFAAPPL